VSNVAMSVKSGKLILFRRLVHSFGNFSRTTKNATKSESILSKTAFFLCILPPMCRQDDSFITFFRFERYHLLNRVGNRSFVFENVSSDTSVHE
jgi:hypothetical protein